MLDENIERLISRKLDGVLADSESVELDRAVLRSPEVRAALDAAARIDELARRALRDGIATPHAAPAVPPELSTDRLRRWHRSVAAGLLAAAASVILATGWQTLRPNGDAGVRTDAHTALDTGASAAGAAAPPFPAGKGWAERYAEVVNREVLGVYDDKTRSLYLLEIDRSHLRPVAVRASY